MTSLSSASLAALASLLLSTPALATPTATTSAPVAADRAGWEGAVHARFGAGAKLSWDAFRETPTAISRLHVATVGIDPGARALAFCGAYRDVLGLAPALALSVADVKGYRDGAVVRLGLSLDGLEVEGRQVAVSLTLGGAVRSVRLDPAPTTLAETAAEVDATAAAAAVTRHFGVSGVGRPTRVAFWRGVGPARPAWRVPTALIPWVAHFYVWVDAETGAVLAQAPVSNDQPLRRLEVAR